MRYTVRQAAELAGVSPATVSRVLNGAPGIRAETRAKVLRVIGSGAGEVKRRMPSSGVIALLMPETYLYGRTFLEQVRHALKIFGARWSVRLFPHDVDAWDFRRRCLRENISGVVVGGFGCATPELAEMVDQLPNVWLNSHITSGTPDVLVGNEQAGRLAARYLADAGCRRPTLAVLPSMNPGFSARCEGFRYECHVRRIEPAEVRIAAETPLEMLGHADLAKLFAASAAAFRQADGIFVPECFAVPDLHRVLRRNARPRGSPRLVCCVRDPDLLAGLDPAPAVVDLGEDLLIDLACRELFQRIAGGARRQERTTIFVSPKLYTPDEE